MSAIYIPEKTCMWMARWVFGTCQIDRVKATTLFTVFSLAETQFRQMTRMEEDR